MTNVINRAFLNKKSAFGRAAKKPPNSLKSKEKQVNGAIKSRLTHFNLTDVLFDCILEM